MKIEEIMRLAEFPVDAVREILDVHRRFESEGKVEELHRVAGMLVELPAETRLLGKELGRITVAWAEEMGIHRYTLELLILLECWVLVKDKYEERGLDMEIFVRSLHDMYCKLMECRNVHGVTGIFVGHWYDRFFDLSRFALGRLQFELIPYPFETVMMVQGRELKKGDWVVNMHIPSEGPLGRDAVEDALERARWYFVEHARAMKLPEKFEKEDGVKFSGVLEEPVIFVMDSWLLDPDLQALLPEGNIKAFTSRFEVVHVQKEEEFADGWRVFGSEWKKRAEELPQNTRLQRAIADWLKKGGKLGEGFGVLVQ